MAANQITPSGPTFSPYFPCCKQATILGNPCCTQAPLWTPTVTGFHYNKAVNNDYLPQPCGYRPVSLDNFLPCCTLAGVCCNAGEYCLHRPNPNFPIPHQPTPYGILGRKLTPCFFELLESSWKSALASHHFQKTHQNDFFEKFY